MLQDKYLKTADVCKTTSIIIDENIEKVFPAVEKLSFEGSKLIYWLFKLRGMPVPSSLCLEGLERLNFVKLETLRNREIILGLIGQFWTPSGKLMAFKPDDFVSFSDKNYAKATWNFELSEINPTSTCLSTETRIFCPTDEIRKKFKLYWTFIQPFSMCIRREILKSIKKQVEKMKPGM